MDDNYVAYQKRSESYCHLAFYQEALKDADDSLNLADLDHNTYINKANALLGLGDVEQAKKLLKDSLKIVYAWEGWSVIENRIKLIDEDLN